MIKFRLSNAVIAACSLDDKETRRQMAVENVKCSRNGAVFEFKSTADLRWFATHMIRGAGWDLSPATVRACNLAAKRAREHADALDGAA